MALKNLVARLIHRFPSFGTLVGLGLFLGFGALGVSAIRDYSAFPKAPVPSTVAEAAARPALGNWVSLTDARFHCELAIPPGSGAAESHNYYVPATDPSGQLSFLISYSNPIVCEEAAKQPVTGVFAELNGRLRSTLGDQDPKFKALPKSPQYVLSVYDGPDNALSELYVAVPMMLLGAALMWFYERQRRTRKLTDQKKLSVLAAQQAAAEPVPAPAAAATTTAAATGPVIDGPLPADALSAWQARGPILPPRPFQLQPDFAASARRKLVLLSPLSLFFVALVAYWQGGEVRQYLAERQLWQTGTLAETLNVAGKTSSKMFLSSADLDITFTTADGRTQHASQSISFAFGDLDQQAPLGLRYDPRDPSKFALSWALDVGVYRMLNVALYSALFGFMALLPLLIGWGAYATLKRARRAAAASDEVLAKLVKVVEQQTNGTPNGMLELSIAVVGEPDDRKPRVVIRSKTGPELLWLDELHIIALRCPATPGKNDDHVLLIEESFHPFAFSESEKAAILARLSTLRSLGSQAA